MDGGAIKEVGVSKILKYICLLQAKDKDRWVRLFSQFCNKTANEEEEIVHKLLGDKFKVSSPLPRLHPSPFPNNLGDGGHLWETTFHLFQATERD